MLSHGSEVTHGPGLQVPQEPPGRAGARREDVVFFDRKAGPHAGFPAALLVLGLN